MALFLWTSLVLVSSFQVHCAPRRMSESAARHYRLLARMSTDAEFAESFARVERIVQAEKAKEAERFGKRGIAKLDEPIKGKEEEKNGLKVGEQKEGLKVDGGHNLQGPVEPEDDAHSQTPVNGDIGSGSAVIIPGGMSENGQMGERRGPQESDEGTGALEPGQVLHGDGVAEVAPAVPQKVHSLTHLERIAPKYEGLCERVKQYLRQECEKWVRIADELDDFERQKRNEGNHPIGPRYTLGLKVLSLDQLEEMVSTALGRLEQNLSPGQLIPDGAARMRNIVTDAD